MEQIKPEELKNQFIGWQCRVRQWSMRKQEGRPSSAMRPRLEAGGEDFGAVTVLIVKTDSHDVTREFKHIVRRTEEPQARHDSAIKLLSEYYYQLPAEFDEELTAVFPVGSALAAKIANYKNCKLHFEQGNQGYHLECQVRLIPRDETKYQTTYWHNHMFNPSMPGVVDVLGFLPQWNGSFSTAAGQQQ